MLRILLVFSVFATSRGATLVGCKANQKGYCWGNVGWSWCWLTNDGKQDHAKLNTGPMVGYECEWYTGKDPERYCEHQGSNLDLHDEGESLSDVSGSGVSPWMANWVLGKHRQTVGRGQCWDLANDAIKAARNNGFNVPQAPSGYVWSTSTVPYKQAKPGDIVQLSSYHESHNGWTLSTWIHHTAVVVRPWDGKGLPTYDQNPGPVKETIYHPQSSTSGSLTVYRITSSRLLQRNLDENLAPTLQVHTVGLVTYAFAAALAMGVGGCGLFAWRFFSSRRNADRVACRELFVVEADGINENPLIDGSTAA